MWMREKFSFYKLRRLLWIHVRSKQSKGRIYETLTDVDRGKKMCVITTNKGKEKMEKFI
jgi:hypothetical protein